MFNKFFATTAIALIVAAPAMAGSLQDPVVDPAPVMPYFEPVSDWTGFYAGVQGAYVFGVAPDRYGPGVHAGYLYDMGDYVLGAEVDYTYLFPLNRSRAGGNVILGYDAGNLMPHVTVGGAWTDVFGPGEFGYGAGAGISFKITEDIVATARYNYVYYPVPVVNEHAISLRLSYRF